MSEKKLHRRFVTKKRNLDVETKRNLKNRSEESLWYRPPLVGNDEDEFVEGEEFLKRCFEKSCERDRRWMEQEAQAIAWRKEMRADQWDSLDDYMSRLID